MKQSQNTGERLTVWACDWLQRDVGSASLLQVTAWTPLWHVPPQLNLHRLSKKASDWLSTFEPADYFSPVWAEKFRPPLLPSTSRWKPQRDGLVNLPAEVCGDVNTNSSCRFVWISVTSVWNTSLMPWMWSSVVSLGWFPAAPPYRLTKINKFIRAGDASWCLKLSEPNRWSLLCCLSTSISHESSMKGRKTYRKCGKKRHGLFACLFWFWAASFCSCSIFLIKCHPSIQRVLTDALKLFILFFSHHLDGFSLGLSTCAFLKLLNPPQPPSRSVFGDLSARTLLLQPSLDRVVFS